MAARDEVEALVERMTPAAVCDDCIADRLGLDRPEHANQKTRELSGRRGFERSKSACSLCGTVKLVIRRS